MPKTLVAGASTNPTRVSFEAVHKLRAHGHEVVPISLKKGQIAGIDLLPPGTPVADVDTITMYIGPQRQAEIIPYLLDLKPRRIIFNPGSENPEFMQQAREAGIEVEAACTLVLLAVGKY